MTIARGLFENPARAPTPGVRSFAVLQGFEAITRGLLISVLPLEMYRAAGDAGLVSSLYFAAGVLSLLSGLMVPFAARFIPRRWLYTLGALLYLAGTAAAVLGGTPWVLVTVICNTMATVITFVCFNAYVLDFIPRRDLSRAESTRMLYAALGWTAGPLTGVLLLEWWPPAPYLLAGASALCLLVTFWVLRMGDGRRITRVAVPPPNPLAFLRRFLAQPRLVAGWLFAVIRSCGWWVYVVYVPIFAVEYGLGDRVGGIVLSITNGLMFLTPLMLRAIQRHTIRVAVRAGFLAAGTFFLAASLGEVWPPVAIACLFAGSGFLVLLDVCGGLPFLMAVKPSERTEMAAVYASFRDVSGIVTPGVAYVVLLMAPVTGIFAVCGLGLWGAYMLAGRLHPRLGRGRLRAD